MRTTLLLAVALLATGCTTTPTTKVPAAAAARDGKTPIAPEHPTLSQRVTEQRIRDGQVAQGQLAVQGQLVR